jgi:hypothetical protein
MWAEEARVTQKGAVSVIEPVRGVVCGPAHLYARLTSTDAPGFDVIGSPGNGSLVIRYAYATNAYMLNLGVNGSWD